MSKYKTMPSTRTITANYKGMINKEKDHSNILFPNNNKKEYKRIKEIPTTICQHSRLSTNNNNSLMRIQIVILHQVGLLFSPG